jgi:SAM-dependent methyltransferase
MAWGEYRSYLAVHPFDRRFGVDTSGLFYDLPTGHGHDRCNNGYFAVAPSVFHQTMERLSLDLPRFTFVDLGSGKGRALLLALDHGFREVIGVEISPRLERIARENIARYRPPREAPPVRSILADAADFDWPPSPLVIYTWNAFTEPVMRRVLENLRASLASRPREAYLVYIHPELDAALEGELWLKKVWEGGVAMNDEDFSAWAFPDRTEICAIYRARPQPE